MANQHNWHGPIQQVLIERLLATRRPGPADRNRAEWSARLHALNFAKPHAIPALRQRLDDETAAMWQARDEWLDREQERRWGPDDQRTRTRTEDDRASLLCEMRDPSVRGMTGAETSKLRICFLDAKPLPKRRQRWCSDECVTRWHENHAWGWARSAALRRDKDACVRCSRPSTTVLVDKCGNCGREWEPSMAVVHDCPKANRYWDGAKAYHQRHRRYLEMEVNHMDPREGRGYHDGCHHHQDRLETLCRPCHVIETTRQGRERRSARCA